MQWQLNGNEASTKCKPKNANWSAFHLCLFELEAHSNPANQKGGAIFKSLYQLYEEGIRRYT